VRADANIAVLVTGVKSRAVCTGVMDIQIVGGGVRYDVVEVGFVKAQSESEYANESACERKAARVEVNGGLTEAGERSGVFPDDVVVGEVQRVAVDEIRAGITRYCGVKSRIVAKSECFFVVLWV
jgi:hypothetical protein